MKYETIVEKSSERITESYAFDGRQLHGTLAIVPLGWIAGMAGWCEHAVTITLQEGDKEFGKLSVHFPMVMRSDRKHPHRMVQVDDSPRAPKRFTPYAQQVINEAVQKFVWMKNTLSSGTFSMTGASLAVKP